MCSPRMPPPSPRKEVSLCKDPGCLPSPLPPQKMGKGPRGISGPRAGLLSQRRLVGQPWALTGFGAEVSRHGDPTKSLTCVTGIKDPEGSRSLKTWLHVHTASSWSLQPDSASPGACSGCCGPLLCPHLGTQPPGKAADLAVGFHRGPETAGHPGLAVFMPAGDREMEEDQLHLGGCLYPEAWRWWPCCSPATIHEWFVALGWSLPGGAGHRAPIAPVGPEGPRMRRTSSLSPPSRPVSTSAVGSWVPPGLTGKERSALSTHGATQSSLFSPDLCAPHQAPTPNL